MPRQGRTWGQVAAALVAFGALGYYAPQYIWGSFEKTGVTAQYAPICDFDKGILPTTYRSNTGYVEIDKFVCQTVAFFTELLEPTPTPFTSYFAWTHLAMIFLPLVESKRPGAWFPNTAPMIFWQAYQMLTVGCASSYAWAFLILFSKQGRGDMVTKRDAWGAVISMVLGGVLPLIAMLTMHDPVATAVWQFFPIIIGVIGVVYSLVVPKSVGRVSGSVVTRLTYFTIFIISAIAHFKYIRTIDFGNMSWPPPSGVSMREGADIFLKWDLVFGYTTFLVGTWFFTYTTEQLVKVVIWSVVGSVVFGPGAALAFLGIWREYDVEVEAGTKHE